jgi:hypothetical protein
VPVTMTASLGSDLTLDTLDDLALTIDENADEEHRLAGRIRRLRAGRAAGRSWEDVLADEPLPGTLELASAVLGRLSQASAALRRTVARGLRAQGVSVAAIAERFGVSRQRISALLKRNES